MSSPCLNRRHKGVQHGRVDRIIAAVMSQIRRFDSVISHRVHQTIDRSIVGHIVQDDGALGTIRGGDVLDRRIVLVISVGVFVVEDGVGPLEELPWGIDPRVEDHWGNIRGNGLVGVGGGVVHICQDARGVGAVDFVEEDAVNRDVLWSVGGPVGIDADVVSECGEGGFGIARVNVPERLDVGVAV